MEDYSINIIFFSMGSLLIPFLRMAPLAIIASRLFCHASLTLIPPATRECVTKRARDRETEAFSSSPVSSHPSSKCSYNGLQCRIGERDHSPAMTSLADGGGVRSQMVRKAFLPLMRGVFARHAETSDSRMEWPSRQVNASWW